MDRPNKTFTPTGGTDVFILKTYATAQEKRDVADAQGIAIEQLPEGQKKYAGTMYGLIQDATVRTMVISINGHKEGDQVDGNAFEITKYMLDMPSSQYDEVFAVIKEALDGEKKSQS